LTVIEGTMFQTFAAQAILMQGYFSLERAKASCLL
jgi:hypothetical protein